MVLVVVAVNYESVLKLMTLIFDILSCVFFPVKEVATFSGHTEEVDGVPAVVGQFSSIGFPRGYSSSGDVFVYYIRNDDTSGHVRLTFEDWNLSPFSSLTVNMANTACYLAAIMIYMG